MSQIITKTFLFVCLLILGIASCGFSKDEPAPWDLIKKCKTLKIGMTSSMITDIMGQPAKTIEFEKSGKIKLRIYYPSPELASEQTQCLIDKETKKVEEIICGESHMITK